MARAYRRAILEYGGVDVVVSNAGLASSAPIEETSVEMWDKNHDVLARGYFLVARGAFRIMKEQGIGGSLVFVASKNSMAAGKNASAYSSAKAAELHLARCLAEEGGPEHIRVNTVNPDAVLQGSRIWDSGWREERAAAYGIRAGRARRLLPRAQRPQGERAARERRRGRAPLRLRGAFVEEHRQRPQRRRRRERRIPEIGKDGGW